MTRRTGRNREPGTVECIVSIFYRIIALIIILKFVYVVFNLCYTFFLVGYICGKKKKRHSKHFSTASGLYKLEYDSKPGNARKGYKREEKNRIHFQVINDQLN